ncbi:MAG: chromate transporter [Erysipelotrichaceae bacterium]|nr:chromate transporter [Erysipelotrichaceae bacterium]
MMILLDLFITFLIIGVSAFGGGYAVMPLIQNYIVDSRHWITMNELADITSLSQMTPGPIMINAATFVGIKVGGNIGGLVATLGSVLPSFILVLILGYLFAKHGNLHFIQNIMKGLRPTIVGLIAVAALSLFITSILVSNLEGSIIGVEITALVSFIVALVISMKTKYDTLVIVLVGAVIGAIAYFI